MPRFEPSRIIFYHFPTRPDSPFPNRSCRWDDARCLQYYWFHEYPGPPFESRRVVNFAFSVRRNPTCKGGVLQSHWPSSSFRWHYRSYNIQILNKFPRTSFPTCVRCLRPFRGRAHAFFLTPPTDPSSALFFVLRRGHRRLLVAPDKDVYEAA